MNPTRASGNTGSIGTYAAPAFNTPTIATTASPERGNNNPTHSPGPAPTPTNTSATRSDASSNSRYVHDRPPQLNATTSGVRPTCAANNPGIDPHTPAGALNAARLLHPSSRARSPSSSRSIDNTRRDKSAVTTNAPNQPPSPPTPAATDPSSTRWWAHRKDLPLRSSPLQRTTPKPSTDAEKPCAATPRLEYPVPCRPELRSHGTHIPSATIRSASHGSHSERPIFDRDTQTPPHHSYQTNAEKHCAATTLGVRSLLGRVT